MATGAGGGIAGVTASQDAIANEAYQNALANISTSRSQLLQQYGYNADGSVDASNPYGLYQQQQRSNTEAQQGLTLNEGNEMRDYNTSFHNSDLSEAGSLDAARSNALARGLHGGGVAGKGESQVQLGGAMQRDQLGVQHSDALASFGRQQSDMTYNQGLGSYQLGLNLTNSLTGLDQQKQGALFDKNAAFNSALMNQIMFKLSNPGFTGGS